MAKTYNFREGGKKREDLEPGTYEPAILEAVKHYEPKAGLEDAKPFIGFHFVYDGKSAVTFCNDSPSKMGRLYSFVVDLLDGEPPADFDLQSLVGKPYRIKVRRKQNSDKLEVATAEPCKNGGDKKPALEQEVAALEGEEDVPF